MAAQACSGSSLPLASVAQAKTLCWCRLHSFPRISPDDFLEGRARAGWIRAWEGFFFMENAMRRQCVCLRMLCCVGQRSSLGPSAAPHTPSPQMCGVLGLSGGVSNAGGFAPGWGCSPEPHTMLQTRDAWNPAIESELCRLEKSSKTP